MVLLLVVVAGVAGVLLHHSGPSYPKQWDSRILPIVRFDEKERGLTFKHPVQVLFMTPAAFDKTVTRRPQLAERQRQAEPGRPGSHAAGAWG